MLVIKFSTKLIYFRCNYLMMPLRCLMLMLSSHANTSFSHNTYLNYVIVCFRNVFPENLAQATIASYRTRLVFDKNDTKSRLGTIMLLFDFRLICFYLFTRRISTVSLSSLMRELFKSLFAYNIHI